MTVHSGKPSPLFSAATASRRGFLSGASAMAMGAMGAAAGGMLLALPGTGRAQAVQEDRPVDSGGPLAGRILDMRSGAFLDQEALLDRMGAARFVLAGETHGNVLHKALLGHWIRRLSESGWSQLKPSGEAGPAPVLALEMVPWPLQSALEKVPAPDDATGWRDFRGALKWDKNHWTHWQAYAVAFIEAQRAGWAFAAADLPFPDHKIIHRKGVGALDPAVLKKLRLVRMTPPEDVEASWLKTLAPQHCDLMDAEELRPMARLQWVRDRVMAVSLLQACGGLAKGAGPEQARRGLLWCGRSHARADRGVAQHLAALGVQDGVLSLGLMEVTEQDTRPEAMLDTGLPGKGPVFDVVAFVPKTQRKDFCSMLEKKGK